MRATALCLITGVVLAASCTHAAAPKIGIVLGTDGMFAARLALETLRASPEADVRAVSIDVLTGRYNNDARAALAAADSLAADPGVVAVVGHSNSAASIAASQVYNARHLVQIAPTTTAPLYSKAGAYSFRLVAGDEKQARFLADQIAASRSPRVAVMRVNDDYGRSLHRLLLIELSARGIHPVYDGAYIEGESGDTAQTIQSIVRARPTTLVWLGRYDFFSKVAIPVRTALPGLTLLASDGLGEIGAIADTVRRFDGVRYVRLVDVGRDSPALQAVRARYRQRGGGTELTDQAALTYDAVLLLAQAIHEVGPDREAIRSWLAALGRTRPPFQGITGPISFSSSGDRLGSYRLETIGDPATRAGH